MFAAVFQATGTSVGVHFRKNPTLHPKNSRNPRKGKEHDPDQGPVSQTLQGVAPMTTPLRAKYIRDLAIRSRAERTQQSYSRYVSELARYYHRSPELISYEEVADWLYYLIKERKLSASSVNIAVNAVRFLYGVTLERNTDQLMASVPRMTLWWTAAGLKLPG